ncbi:hypothetical protein KP509_34G004000 [Ceratopteris richardii]|uniref:SHSP domain-containing protein n=1 Tax=Ceratopteris richardii TaxID=49495 RepID=A0A8T2QHL6_CERRI|nr:hypothetical protein KP509_1Z296400 [Ceratopteris richardii]KAH7283379.1 hypothetical protein KP509_34G004000 [Ceratopteris richardii]
MALLLFRRSDNPSQFDTFGSFVAGIRCDFSSLPDVSTFARDVDFMRKAQVDWTENSHAYVFKLNLPGMVIGDLKVQVVDGQMIQISSEKKSEQTQSSEHWHRVEHTQKTFVRRFRLPENVKAYEVKAFMQNGMLTITVPKIFSFNPFANVAA